MTSVAPASRRARAVSGKSPSKQTARPTVPSSPVRQTVSRPPGVNILSSPVGPYRWALRCQARRRPFRSYSTPVLWTAPSAPRSGTDPAASQMPSSRARRLSASPRGPESGSAAPRACPARAAGSYPQGHSSGSTTRSAPCRASSPARPSAADRFSAGLPGSGSHWAMPMTASSRTDAPRPHRDLGLPGDPGPSHHVVEREDDGEADQPGQVSAAEAPGDRPLEQGGVDERDLDAHADQVDDQSGPVHPPVHPAGGLEERRHVVLAVPD